MNDLTTVQDTSDRIQGRRELEASFARGHARTSTRVQRHAWSLERAVTRRQAQRDVVIGVEGQTLESECALGIGSAQHSTQFRASLADCGRR